LADSSPRPRITRTIDESSLVTLHGNTHPLAQWKFDQGPAPVSMPANRLLLVLARSTEQEADLQTWLQSVQDANSPNYRHFLSPEDFGQRFGVGDADLQSIRAWLTSRGLTVNKVSKGRMAIEFTGSVGQVQSAFHTSIHSYLIGGVRHWANAIDPQIPSALAPVVAGLASLNDFKPRAQYIRGPSGVYNAQKHTVTPTYTVGDATNGYDIFLGPADAATIYNAPTTLNANLSGTAYTGAGVTIGIAGDSNIDITQNANYRSTFGLAANPTTVVVDGADPGENGDAVEAYLDTQVAGGIAPGANIILYTAADTNYDAGLFLAILRALDDNEADILNVSFGACEADQGSSGNQYILNLWEQAAAQGISVTVSSGDNGSAGCDDENTEQYATQGLAVNGLGSTPYNISVGGTDFDILGSNFPTSFTTYVDVTNTLSNHRSARRYIPEEPWNDSTYPNSTVSADESLSALTGSSSSDNIVAGSGGISSIYPVPDWQAGFASGNYRNLPDVSFLAGNGFYGALWGLCTDLDTDSNGNAITDCAAPTTGDDFNLTGVGGTSAAAPAFAGMLALIQQKTGTRLGQADYAIYNLAKRKYSTVFHDVTTGDNSVNCQAFSSADCVSDTAGYYFLSGYNATAGYDMASGLGSVDVSQLASNWPSTSFIATSSSLELNGGTAALSITHGQSVAVSASVTSTSGTPTGDIALVDNLSPARQPNSESGIGFTLANGSASGTTTLLPGGTYKVSAHYGGSGSFAESDSNAIPVTVASESSTTSLKVTGYYDPATGKAASTPYYGYIYWIDAQPYGNSASSANPNGAATGTITFKNGSKTLGTAALASDGIAELQTAALSGGNNSLTAVFPGDASFQASTSAPYSFTVVPAVTTLSTPAYQNLGNDTLSLNVTLLADSAGIAPTGTVTFQDGSTKLGTAQLVGTAGTGTSLAGGAASFTTAALSAGSHNIDAFYSGDGNYASSTSPTISYSFSAMSVWVNVTTPQVSTPTNQPVQVVVQITPLESTSQAPTGTITLSFNGQTMPAVNIANGSATITIPANTLPVGSTIVTANYSGDSYFAQASGTGYVNMKATGTITPTVAVITPTGTVGYPVSVTVTVSGPNGDATPTGSVWLAGSFLPNSEPLTLVNGSVTSTIQNGLVGGTNTLTATYLGDSNYTSGSGTGVVNLKATPIITFTPYEPTIVVNQPLNMTVTVSGSTGAATATGTVTLSSGGYTSSSVQLTSGSASFTIPANSLVAGSNSNSVADTLTASYGGDTNYLAGISSEYVFVTAVQTPGLTIPGVAVSLTPGATSNNTFAINIVPTGGFTGYVVLTAAITSSPAGAQDLPTLSFGSTSPVTIVGDNTGTAYLTVSTTAATTAALAHPKGPGVPWYAAGGTTLACLLLFGIPARRRSWRTLLGMLVLLVAFAGVVSCGGGGSSGGGGNGGGGGGTGSSGTTAGTYLITVTGTSGATSAQGVVTLIVQ
jgi:hypothetical protein